MALRVATPIAQPEKVIAAASGSTYGKIGTVAASGTLYAGLALNQGPGPGTSMVDVRVKSDQAYRLAFYVARSNVLSATITLADAAAVDDTDTFVLNGLTFTAESTEGDASAAARKYWTGASNAAAAVNLTALLNDATYGVPGASFSVAAVDATDVITVSATNAHCLQFVQGASDAGEIAWSESTLASLTKLSGEDVTGAAANSTTTGTIYKIFTDGYPYLFVSYTNGSGATAANITIGATPHDSV